MTFKPSANPFAKLTPVNNEPANPGPLVTAIPSILSILIDASLIDKNERYVLSDVNVVKLLHDHGADVNEWKEDCKRYNDPEEILLWLGY